MDDFPYALHVAFKIDIWQDNDLLKRGHRPYVDLIDRNLAGGATWAPSCIFFVLSSFLLPPHTPPAPAELELHHRVETRSVQNNFLGKADVRKP